MQDSDEEMRPKKGSRTKSKPRKAPLIEDGIDDTLSGPKKVLNRS
jgi:hypothetical protein